jgi:pimeloyl-ACP methyl ester carboxylesterase
MKKWLKMIGAGLLVLVVSLIVVGSFWEQAQRKSVARDFPAPGILVDVGENRRIQIDCRGSGSPTIVLESGLDISGSLAWTAVHDKLANITRTCAYSRAGIMWSTPADPRGPKEMVDDLANLLDKAGARPPLLLVGHSLGGPLALLFTKYYGERIAGLVLVEPSHPEQLDRLRAFGPLQASPGRFATFLGRATVATGLFRVVAKLMPGIPNHSADSMKAIRAYMPLSLTGMYQERRAIPDILAMADTARNVGSRPLTVLGATRIMSAAERKQARLSESQARELLKARHDMLAEMAAWSTSGAYVEVPDAGHYIQFDRPDAVIDSVRSMVEDLRLREATMTPAAH